MPNLFFVGKTPDWCTRMYDKPRRAVFCANGDRIKISKMDTPSFVSGMSSVSSSWVLSAPYPLLFIPQHPFAEEKKIVQNQPIIPSPQKPLSSGQFFQISKQVPSPFRRNPGGAFKPTREVDQLRESIIAHGAVSRQHPVLRSYIEKRRSFNGYRCTICHKHIRGPTSFFRHVMAHLELEVHTCEGCGKIFSQKTNLDIHFQAMHTFRQKLRCPIVGCREGEFRYERSLFRHMKRTHKMESKKAADVNPGKEKRFFCMKGCDRFGWSALSTFALFVHNFTEHGISYSTNGEEFRANPL